jgi:hypothetical protein
MKLKELLQFVNAVKGGNKYIPEKGFREAMKTGPIKWV